MVSSSLLAWSQITVSSIRDLVKVDSSLTALLGHPCGAEWSSEVPNTLKAAQGAQNTLTKSNFEFENFGFGRHFSVSERPTPPPPPQPEVGGRVDDESKNRFPPTLSDHCPNMSGIHQGSSENGPSKVCTENQKIWKFFLSNSLDICLSISRGHSCILGVLQV